MIFEVDVPENIFVGDDVTYILILKPCDVAEELKEE